MKGYPNHASTGERAHEWAHILQQEVSSRELYADFAGMNPQGREVALALGAKVPPYEFFVERVGPREVSALDRWKALQDDGWEVTALTAEDGGQLVALVGLGYRYRSALEATA